jgi:hypothetical protein
MRRICSNCGHARDEKQFPFGGDVCGYCSPASKPDTSPLSFKPLLEPHVLGQIDTTIGRHPGVHNSNTSFRKMARQFDTLANQLGKKEKDTLANFVATHSLYDDTRPLIDIVHEATFLDSPGLQYLQNPYDLRMLLRKAHCFTLNAETSRLVADFSLAITADLDAARQMAIPPFPVTWIELDNRARLDQLKGRGIPLTSQAAGNTDAGEAVPRVGWLIWEAKDLGGFYMMYATVVQEGVIVSPLAWWWHNGTPFAIEKNSEDEFIEWLTFGVRNTGVGCNAYVCPSSLHKDYARDKLFSKDGHYSEHIRDYMKELAGELRHVFGLLVALGSTHLGTITSWTPQDKPTGPLRMIPGKNKPLLPLEHKHLHIHLMPRSTVEKVTMRAITHHKKRQHEVRAHWRILRDKNGNERKRVAVRSHIRGDERLGRVTKTYHIDR